MTIPRQLAALEGTRARGDFAQIARYDELGGALVSIRINLWTSTITVVRLHIDGDVAAIYRELRCVSAGRRAQQIPDSSTSLDVRAPTVPLKVGWLPPHDVSPVFLASDVASTVTGAEYEVTGGDSAKAI